MNNTILTSTDIQNEGKKIAFVAGNRDVLSKNKKSKITSLTKCKMNLVPILLVKGDKAVADGCTLVNPTDGKPIEDDASRYYVVVDGQHRYTAAMELNDKVTLYFYLDYSGINTKELLSITNIDSTKWTAKDFAKGAVLYNPNDELIKYVSDLTQKKMPISTISIYLYGSKDALTSKQLADSLSEGKLKQAPNLEVVKSVMPKLCYVLGDKFVNTRYCANAFINVLMKKGSCTAVNAINSLTEDDVKAVKELKADEAKEKLSEIILSKCS